VPVPNLEARLARSGIVAAGVRVFARRGFAKVRVEDILRAADIARRTFYKHFAGKEEVLAEIYEVTTRELLRVMDDAARAAGDALAGLRLGVDVYLDFHVENAALLRVLVEQAIRSESPLAPLRKRFRAELAQRMERAAAAKGKDRGAATSPARPSEGRDRAHVDFLHTAVLSALEGLSLELLERGPSREDVLRAKRAMRALVEWALGAPAKR
jgi:AcrR family transcriptional regulator